MEEIAAEYDCIFWCVDSVNVAGRYKECFALQSDFKITLPSISHYLLHYNAHALFVNIFAHLVEELHTNKLFLLVLCKGINVRFRWRYNVEDLHMRCK